MSIPGSLASGSGLDKVGKLTGIKSSFVGDHMSRKDCFTEQVGDNLIPRPMVPYRVFVAGFPCDIAVYSTSKSCIAVGVYRGKCIKVSGADALSAVDAWTKAARVIRA